MNRTQYGTVHLHLHISSEAYTQFAVLVDSISLASVTYSRLHLKKRSPAVISTDMSGRKCSTKGVHITLGFKELLKLDVSVKLRTYLIHGHSQEGRVKRPWSLGILQERADR